ncbi:MAG: tripartite tricarboxylate transporter substrate binding protein [Rhizobiales bacterium]|nr:tripartite tricarboxylate transporter substrate binding protein [Hyphomicrobiales bacterium]
MKKLLATTLAAAAFAVAGNTSASAADIPCDTAQLIVPWKAGGGTHVIFSIFEKTIQEMDVKPKIKVVTVPGQGGNKGAKQAAKAKPDGCTLFAIHQSAITSFLNGRIDFQYDGFETVANLTMTPDIVGAKAGAPYKNFKEFAAYAKANPKKIKAGTTFGSTSHFIWLLLAKEMGVEFSYVPYDGTRERMTALLSGAIDVGALNVASGSKYLSSGELQGFAIAADERAKQLPDMPTLKEEGVNMTFALERGIVAPKGTPKDVIEHWAGIFKKASEVPDLMKQMDAKGTGLRYQGPEDFRKWADALYSDYEAVAIEIGMFKK